MASPYDRLLGIPPMDEQGATRLVPATDPSASLLPPSMAAPAEATAGPPPANLLDPARFLTVSDFYDSPGYKAALLPEKQQLEKDYARTYLTPARMKAAGATQAQQAEASADFNQRRAKVEKGGMFDTDLLDMPAYGLATAAGGVARVLGFDEFADRAAADAERIKRENFSPETRYKLEQEQVAAKKLAKEYGGEDNVPWWAEIVQGLSNFSRQPVNKTLQAIGSSAPVLASAVVPGGAGVAMSVLASALLTAGDSAEGAYQKIVNMPEDALQNSIEYVEARSLGQNHEEARRTVADRAVREAAMLAAPIGAASGLVGLRYGAEGLLRGGTGVVRRTAGEVAQEGVEEGSGQTIQNRAVQRADPEQNLLTGAFTAGAEGAAAGGGMSLGVAAATGVAGLRRAPQGGNDQNAADQDGTPPDAPPEPEAPPLDSDLESAMQTPGGSWDDPGTATAPTPTPAAALNPAPVPGNYPTPEAPGMSESNNSFAAASAMKALYSADTSDAQLAGMEKALPEWIRADPSVNSLLLDLGNVDPETDAAAFQTYRDDLIGRVAYIQASEAARWQGNPNVSELLQTLPKGAVRDRFLPAFTGPLWNEGVRKSFSRNARVATSPGISDRPIPPGVPARVPLEGTVQDPQEAAMTSLARPPVRLPDATISDPAPAQPEASEAPPVPAGPPSGGSRGADLGPTPEAPPRPAASPPVAPPSTRAVEQQGQVAVDATRNWTKPNRKSRAAKSFDPAALTEVVTNAERQALLGNRPVDALLSIAARNDNSILGEFAKDLVRTMAGEVKTRAGREAMATVAARFSQGGGGRGQISFSSQAPVTTHTALHEFAHALTAARIRNPITDAQKAAVRQLTQQMQWVAQNLPANHEARRSVVMGAFSNPAEFAAEVYTNPVLQNYLKSVPSSNVQKGRKTRGNLWDQFIEAVSKLMKLRGTALMDTLMTLREVDDGRINREAEAEAATASAGTGQPEAGEAGQGTRNQGGSAGGTQAPDERGGPDNSELPSTGETSSASDGALDEDARDPGVHAGNPQSTGRTGTVAEIADAVMAGMDENDQATVLAAAASIGLTPEQMLANVARYGVKDLRKVDAGLARVLDTAASNMDLFAQSPLLMKAQTALDAVLSTPSNIRKYEDLVRLAATGESPRINTIDSIWAKAREKYIDSATPFLKALGWDQNAQVWKKYKRGGSKLQEQNKILNQQFADLNRQVNAFAKQHGVPLSQTFDYIDRYTSARYVANGANEELAQRKRESYDRDRAALLSLQRHITKVMARPNADPLVLRALRMKANSLQKQIQKAMLWKAEYDRLNDLVRGRDRDLNGGATDRQPGHRFIAGMTRQEAKEFVDGVTQRFGPAMPQVAAIADSIVNIHRFWANRALDGGLFFAKEAAQWSQVRFRNGSGDFYVPTTGNDNLKDQEEAYGIGGVFYKDYAEEGREHIGNGAYMSVVHFASSMARRLAYQEFTQQLYEDAKVGKYGFQAVGVMDSVAGNSRSFLYKEQLPNGNPVIHKIVLNNEPAADALVGANRQQVEASVIKGLSSFTSFFGFMVTQATLMFGPINAARDLGEKTYTMIARHGDVDKGRFLSQTASNIANPENWKAAMDFAFNRQNSSQAGKELEEFARLGGLNTRTGSINREAEAVISAIRSQSPGFQQLGQLKDAIGKYNEAWEILSALATYRALKGSMKGPVDEVAFRMLDAMNFGQSGTSSPFMRAFYLFFNPTVQGARNTYESLIKDIHKNTPDGARKRRVAFVMLMAATALYAAAKEFGGDDDDFGNKTDNLASATISRNIPIWIGDSYIRIPVPFGAPAVLWNIAVGMSRFASGSMSAPEAALHMLQGAAEHTIPFPISQVDIGKDPAFWLMKTLVPQALGPILNIGSDKNDFGDKLTAPMPGGRSDLPDFMRGRRATPQAWKDVAKTAHDMGLGDFHPETWKEASRLAFVGPTENLLQWAIGVQQKEGDLGYVAKTFGFNRVFTNDPRGLLRAFYTAQQRASELTSQVYASAGEPPKGFRGDARKAAIMGWIASSNLSPEEQQIVQLYKDFDDRLKKANTAKSGEDPQDVMRDYMRQYRRIIGE